MRTGRAALAGRWAAAASCSTSSRARSRRNRAAVPAAARATGSRGRVGAAGAGAAGGCRLGGRSRGAGLSADDALGENAARVAAALAGAEHEDGGPDVALADGALEQAHGELEQTLDPLGLRHAVETAAGCHEVLEGGLGGERLDLGLGQPLGGRGARGRQAGGEALCQPHPVGPAGARGTRRRGGHAG